MLKNGVIFHHTKFLPYLRIFVCKRLTVQATTAAKVDILTDKQM